MKRRAVIIVLTKLLFWRRHLGEVKKEEVRLISACSLLSRVTMDLNFFSKPGSGLGFLFAIFIWFRSVGLSIKRYEFETLMYRHSFEIVGTAMILATNSSPLWIHLDPAAKNLGTFF